MAWLPTDPEKDKDKQAADQAAGPVLGAPGAAPIQGSGGGQAAATGAPTKSGSFTNLNNYVTANAGNDATMGAAARGGVQQSANKADAAGTSVYDTGTTAVEAGTVRDDGTIQAVTNLGVVKPVTQTRTVAATPKAAAGAPAPAPARAPAPVGRAPKPVGTPVVSAPGRQPAATPKAAPAAPINAEQFGKQYNAEYDGPKTASAVSGYGEADAAYGKVDAQGKLAKGDLSERGQLLDNVYGQDGKQYSQGEKRLDSFILGAGSEGRQALDGIGNDFGDYSGGWRGIQSMLGGKIDEGKATTTATRDGTRAASKTSGDTLESAVTTGAGDAKRENDKATATLAAAQKRDPAALASLGLSQDAINFLIAHPEADFKSVIEDPTAYGVSDFTGKEVTGNYSQLLNLINGAGGTAKAIDGDLTTFGGHGPSIKADVKSGLNDSTAAFAKAEKQTKDRVARQNSDWLLTSQQPRSELFEHYTEFGLTKQQRDDILDYATEDEIRGMFHKNAVAGLGDYASDPAFAQLYKMLGMDTTSLGRKGTTGKGYSFDAANALGLVGRHNADKAAAAAKIAEDTAAAAETERLANEHPYDPDDNTDYSDRLTNPNKMPDGYTPDIADPLVTRNKARDYLKGRGIG